MKKSKLLLILSLILCACHSGIKRFTVTNYYHTWEYVGGKYDTRHLIHIAEFKDNVKQESYVKVPLDYHKKTVQVDYYGQNDEYYIEINGTTKKVYSNGWRYYGNE